MSQAENRFSILHAGNLWLDRFAPRLRADRPEDRRAALRESFRALFGLFDTHRVRLALFSGNLTEYGYADNGTLSFLSDLFASRPDCHFVIAPGEDDRFAQDSIYASGRFPKNVHIFSEELLSRFDFDEVGISVYGFGHCGRPLGGSLLARRRVSDKNRLNILCGSGFVGEGGFATEEELAHFGANYVALTDTAPFSGFRQTAGTLLAYSGFFESRDFSACGAGGINLIKVEKEGDVFRLTGERLPVDTLRYETERVEATSAFVKDPADVLTRIVKDRGYGEKTALLVRLVGDVTPETVFTLPEDGAPFGLYALRFEDETLPLRAAAYLAHAPSAAGELYRALLPAMQGEDADERKKAAAVFRAGYAALRGKNGVTFRKNGGGG